MHGRCKCARVVVPVRLAREHVAAVDQVAVVLLDHAVEVVVDPQRVVGVVRDARPVEVLRADSGRLSVKCTNGGISIDVRVARHHHA